MATVDLYLATKTEIVRMTRDIDFERLPSAGEWIRIDAGGLLSHEVTEITHNMEAGARVVLGIQRDGDKWEHYNGTEEDLLDDINALVSEGWSLESRVANTAHGNDD